MNRGEIAVSKTMREYGYEVNDVTKNPQYFDKDIDFIVRNPDTGKVTTIEVKSDSRMHDTGNLFIEFSNPRSKEGKGWYCFCQAEFLAYFDEQANSIHIFRFEELKELIKSNSFNARCTADYSYGWIVPLMKIRLLDSYREILI